MSGDCLFFGFITADDGRDVYVHRNHVKKGHRLSTGTRVVFARQYVPPGHPVDLYVPTTDFHGYLSTLRLNSPSIVQESEHRMPIGLLSVIGNVSGDTMRDFYRRRYHPKLMAVVAVTEDEDDDEGEEEEERAAKGDCGDCSLEYALVNHLFHYDRSEEERDQGASMDVDAGGGGKAWAPQKTPGWGEKASAKGGSNREVQEWPWVVERMRVRREYALTP